jgi:hypothetical protein
MRLPWEHPYRAVLVGGNGFGMPVAQHSHNLFATLDSKPQLIILALDCLAAQGEAVSAAEEVQVAFQPLYADVRAAKLAEPSNGRICSVRAGGAP